MARSQSVTATQRSIVLKDDAYYLSAKIIEGPTQYMDKVILVKLTSEQMNAIGFWQPIESGCRLDLQSYPGKEN